MRKGRMFNHLKELKELGNNNEEELYRLDDRLSDYIEMPAKVTLEEA